jgi:hypothetical protein
LAGAAFAVSFAAGVFAVCFFIFNIAVAQAEAGRGQGNNLIYETCRMTPDVSDLRRSLLDTPLTRR